MIQVRRLKLPQGESRDYLELRRGLFMGFISCFGYGQDLYVGWTFYLRVSPLRWLLMALARVWQTLMRRGTDLYVTLRYDSARAMREAMHSVAREGIDVAADRVRPQGQGIIGSTMNVRCRRSTPSVRGHAGSGCYRRRRRACQPTARGRRCPIPVSPSPCTPWWTCSRHVTTGTCPGPSGWPRRSENSKASLNGVADPAGHSAAVTGILGEGDELLQKMRPSEGFGHAILHLAAVLDSTPHRTAGPRPSNLVPGPVSHSLTERTLTGRQAVLP